MKREEADKLLHEKVEAGELNKPSTSRRSKKLFN